MPRRRKLARSFYDRPTLEVAPDLLGKLVVFMNHGDRLSARIVEVEAYVGQDDPACHAARGQTKRNAVMFGPPGFSYVYFVYGMYHCLNFVTERKGFPAAVLIRAAEPVDGLEIMQCHSPRGGHEKLLAGPGKLCRGMGLTVHQSGLDLTGDELWAEDQGETVQNVVTASRIGIRQGGDLPWRFYDGDSAAVSRHM